MSRSELLSLDISKFKDRTHTEESRKKIGKSMTGEKNHNYGKLSSKETKRKISKSKLGKPNNRKNYKPSKETKEKIRKSVLQYWNKKNVGEVLMGARLASNQ